MSSDLAELTTIKVECNKLRKKVLGLEEEERKFEEHYDLLGKQKDLVEDKVISLDGEVECLSWQVDTLEAEKVVDLVEEKHKFKE